MADLLIRGLSESTINKLKSRAEANNRSLQAELKIIVEHAAATLSMADAKRLALNVQARLSNRKHSDSTPMVAEDRER